MSQSVYLNHNIANDPIFSKWRKTFYSNLPPTQINAPSGEIIAELCFNHDCEDGTHYRSLLTPGSYFSPALNDYKNWNEKHWKLFLTGLKKAKGWDLCRLMMLNESAMNRIQSFCKRSALPYLMSEYQFRVVPGSQTFDDYLKTRSTKFNANQRRCFRNFEKSGFTFTHDMTFNEIKEVYKNRNLKKGEGDYAVTEAFLNMLENMRRDFQAENRWYEIGVRSSDGTLAAFALGPWDHEKTFYLFQTAHDPQFHSFRLGALVFDILIQEVLNKGCSYISFMSNSDYLAQFSDTLFTFKRIDIHNRTLKGVLIFIKNAVIRLRAKLKENSSNRPKILEDLKTS